MRRKIVLLGLLVVLSAPPAAVAEEAKPAPFCPICDHANAKESDYPTKAGTTLARGAANTLLGWTELIQQPAEEAKAGGNVLIGIGKGIGAGVGRTVVGLGDLFTFWTPKVEGHYLRLTHDCPVCMGKVRKQ